VHDLWMQNKFEGYKVLKIVAVSQTSSEEIQKKINLSEFKNDSINSDAQLSSLPKDEEGDI
jgi:hypothetical protein